MAKRFADTEIWKKNWFRKLTPLQKCLFKYLCDNCDHAGLLDIDFELMSFQIGGSVKKSDLDIFGDMVNWVSNDKILINSFIQFQYNVSGIEELNKENKVHKSVLNLLSKYDLSPLQAPCIAPILGSKDKDKDKDKEKEKETEDKSIPKPPKDLDEVLDYCYLTLKNYKFDAWGFYEWYESVHWYTNKSNPIRNWKNKLTTAINSNTKGLSDLRLSREEQAQEYVYRVGELDRADVKLKGRANELMRGLKNAIR